MQQVKNYLKTLESYIKSEKDSIAELEKQTNVYTADYISLMKKESHERIKNKQEEIRKLINERIELKLSISNEKKIVEGINSAEYQALVTNLLTKIQMLGGSISKHMISDMLTPVIEKKDISTLESVRRFIQNIPGNTMPDKKGILELIPRIPDEKIVYENARDTINKLMNANAFENAHLSGAIGLKYLEDSGVFEL